MSKLLIDEPPIQVLPSLAKMIGLNQAIVLQQLHYWLQNPKCEGEIIEGVKWIYNNYLEWQRDNFPFWSISTIQRIFADLEKENLIVSIQARKSEYDRTKYYRIRYEILNDRSCQFDIIEDSKLTSSSLTETTSETTITTSSKNEDVATPKKPAKQRDPRLDHPTIKAYREIMHLQVPEPLRDDLVKINDPNIATHFKDWLGRGYNPRNIKGILEAYSNGNIGKPKSAAPAAQEVYQ